MSTMEQLFLFLTYLSYFFYFVIYFNLWEKGTPGYLNDTRYFLQFYVAILLIYFFNPFVKKTNLLIFIKKLLFRLE